MCQFDKSTGPRSLVKHFECFCEGSFSMKPSFNSCSQLSRLPSLRWVSHIRSGEDPKNKGLKVLEKEGMLLTDSLQPGITARLLSESLSAPLQILDVQPS